MASRPPSRPRRFIPERMVVSWNGDGCFLMNGQELATAVQYGLAVIFIVVDNGMYGTIRMHQERNYPARVSGTDLVNPDFAALARAYGAHGETVTRTEEFAPAFDARGERQARAPAFQARSAGDHAQRVARRAACTGTRRQVLTRGARAEPMLAPPPSMREVDARPARRTGGCSANTCWSFWRRSP